MTTDLTNTGIDPAALQRYLDQQIYTLPGVGNRRETFTILLLGSRVIGQYTPPGWTIDDPVYSARDVT